METIVLPNILKISQVLVALKMSAPTLYRLAKEDARLRPFKLGERASAWEAAKVKSWLDDRIRGIPAGAGVAA